jgi:hypothetical protein
LNFKANDTNPDSCVVRVIPIVHNSTADISSSAGPTSAPLDPTVQVAVSALTSLFYSYLPTIILYLVNSQLLPWAIYFAGLAEKHKENSVESRELFKKYITFMFVTTGKCQLVVSVA